MSNNIREGQNTTDGGFWHKDWHTDATTDVAIRNLEGTKGDGVSGEEMDKLLNSAADYGQVTEREYSALKQYIGANWDRMSPEAQAKWTTFDKAMQEAGGKGTAQKHHGQDEVVIMTGAQLENLMKNIGETGKSAPAAPATAPPADGVDKPGSVPTTTTPSPDGSTTTTSTPAHNEPPAPPSEPSAPSQGGGITGNSWFEILQKLMDKIEQKEQKLKDKAKALEGKTEQEIGKGELMEIDMGMKEIQQLFQTVTNIMQAQHDTIKAGLSNLRV